MDKGNLGKTETQDVLKLKKFAEYEVQGLSKTETQDVLKLLFRELL